MCIRDRVSSYPTASVSPKLTKEDGLTWDLVYRACIISLFASRATAKIINSDHSSFPFEIVITGPVLTCDFYCLILNRNWLLNWSCAISCTSVLGEHFFLSEQKGVKNILCQNGLCHKTVLTQNSSVTKQFWHNVKLAIGSIQHTIGLWKKTEKIVPHYPGSLNGTELRSDRFKIGLV